tara:strand:+ start:280 stop:504 length:225 start_codon:yes stop_codon:yes gene_type:complete
MLIISSRGDISHVAEQFQIGDLVETIYYSRCGIVLQVVPAGTNIYLPECHALIAFVDGLTYWKLCSDLCVISKG